MRILPPFEEKIRGEVRNELAKKPTLGITELKERLQDTFGRDFHFSYVRKLVGKVRNEISYEIDTATIEPRLAGIRENYRLMRERLLKIIYWQPDPDWPEGVPQKPPINRDVIEAAKNLVMMDLALLQAEAAAGLYKKPVAEIAKEIRYDPLPRETRLVIIQAWERGGMLPKAAVEEMVPAAHE